MQQNPYFLCKDNLLIYVKCDGLIVLLSYFEQCESKFHIHNAADMLKHQQARN